MSSDSWWDDRKEVHTYGKINSFRKSVGLAPIESGKRSCLKCEREFESSDLKSQHMCDGCRRTDVEDSYRLALREI